MRPCAEFSAEARKGRLLLEGAGVTVADYIRDERAGGGMIATMDLPANQIVFVEFFEKLTEAEIEAWQNKTFVNEVLNKGLVGKDRISMSQSENGETLLHRTQPPAELRSRTWRHMATSKPQITGKPMWFNFNTRGKSSNMRYKVINGDAKALLATTANKIIGSLDAKVSIAAYMGPVAVAFEETELKEGRNADLSAVVFITNKFVRANEELTWEYDLPDEEPSQMSEDDSEGWVDMEDSQPVDMEGSDSKGSQPAHPSHISTYEETNPTPIYVMSSDEEDEAEDYWELYLKKKCIVCVPESDKNTLKFKPSDEFLSLYTNKDMCPPAVRSDGRMLPQDFKMWPTERQFYCLHPRCNWNKLQLFDQIYKNQPPQATHYTLAATRGYTPKEIVAQYPVLLLKTKKKVNSVVKLYLRQLKERNWDNYYIAQGKTEYTWVPNFTRIRKQMPKNYAGMFADEPTLRMKNGNPTPETPNCINEFLGPFRTHGKAFAADKLPCVKGQTLTERAKTALCVRDLASFDAIYGKAARGLSPYQLSSQCLATITDVASGDTLRWCYGGNKADVDYVDYVSPACWGAKQSMGWQGEKEDRAKLDACYNAALDLLKQEREGGATWEIPTISNWRTKVQDSVVADGSTLYGFEIKEYSPKRALSMAEYMMMWKNSTHTRNEARNNKQIPAKKKAIIDKVRAHTEKEHGLLFSAWRSEVIKL